MREGVALPPVAALSPHSHNIQSDSVGNYFYLVVFGQDEIFKALPRLRKAQHRVPLWSPPQACATAQRHSDSREEKSPIQLPLSQGRQDSQRHSNCLPHLWWRSQSQWPLASRPPKRHRPQLSISRSSQKLQRKPRKQTARFGLIRYSVRFKIQVFGSVYFYTHARPPVSYLSPK